MADDSPLTTERWIEKTNALVGVDLSQPAPEMRYQLLEGRVHTLQLFPDGSRAMGEVEPNALPFVVQADGWYNWDGAFLGDEPNLPDWVDE